MANLVTVEEAARHLLIDLVTDGGSPPVVTDERLPDLEDKIEQASDIIIDYLKYDPTGWDADTVPRPVKAATLILLGAMWEDREGKGSEVDYLRDNGTIARLLRRMRDPTLA